MKKPMAPGSKIGAAKVNVKEQGFTMDTKVAAASSKSSIGKNPSQMITGKLPGMTSMGNGNKGLGQAVKTVKSNPIQGAKNEQAGNTQMGSGGVINPFV